MSSISRVILREPELLLVPTTASLTLEGGELGIGSVGLAWSLSDELLSAGTTDMVPSDELEDDIDAVLLPLLPTPPRSSS